MPVTGCQTPGCGQDIGTPSEATGRWWCGLSPASRGDMCRAQGECPTKEGQPWVVPSIEI